MALRDQPYLPLYVLDFLVDEKLAYCSAESTGVYIRLMCILHMLKQMATVTKKVEKPDTLALSSDAYIEIQNKRIEGTATTVLKYIQDNIPDIKQIVSCPELDADSVETNPYAAASDGKAVALLFKNDSRKLSIENPLPFMQYPIQTQGLEVVVPCEARTAGAMIYYPMSLLIAVGV